MRNESHTLIATARRAVNAYRKRAGWSRETVTTNIVETFESMRGSDSIGLRFDPHTHDTFERAKVNADKLFRWLDDESKENNLLPSNFLPYLLAALPLDLRVQLATAIVQPGGLSVHVTGDQQSVTVVEVLQHVAKEGGEATTAIAGLIGGADADGLRSALGEINESIAAQEEARALIEQRLRDARGTAATGVRAVG